MMQGIKSRAQVKTLLSELTLQPELNENSNVILLTSNELANLLLKVSSDIRSGSSIDKLLENTVKALGESGIAERILLFQLNNGDSKAYVTNYWSSSYVPSFDPVGFQIDLKDPPFKLFQSTKSNTLQVEDIGKYITLPNYLFRNKYKALFLKLKTKSVMITVGTSDNVRIVLNLQFSTRSVVWSNEIEKGLQSIVDQLTNAIEKFSEEKKKFNLQKSVAKLKEKAATLREELLRQFASDVHDLPCSVIPNLKEAISKKDFAECNRLVDELHGNLRQMINEYIIPDMSLLGFVSSVYQFVNGFKKSFRGKAFVEMPDEEISIPHKHAVELFKVIKEWFCNIDKHSKATKVDFKVQKLNELYFTIDISDNGVGFEIEHAKTHGYGIFNVERRLKEINAKYEINSKLGEGSKLKIQVPIT